MISLELQKYCPCNHSYYDTLCFFCSCLSFQRMRAVFVTHCVKGAAGGQGPASVCPAKLSNVALSVWTSVTSIRGKNICVCVIVWVWLH